MNVFQYNTGVSEWVIKNAEYDIRRYSDFIQNSIELLKRETYEIKLSKIIVDNEIRYIPLEPKDNKSEKAIDLLFDENTKTVFVQKKNFQRSDAIHIKSRNEDENYFTLSSEIEGDTLYLKPDIYQLDQQKRALDNLRSRPMKEHRALLEIFGPVDSGFWSQNSSKTRFDWKILTNNNSSGVDEQREFVNKGVNTKDFALLEGPPGSGKTTTIIELIIQFASEGKRILLCSATHAAIDNVIERVTGRFSNQCDDVIVPVRISYSEGPVKESVRRYMLQNLVSTYKKKIESYLQNNQKLESQQYLLKNLYTGNESNVDPIEKMILESANLVCGTMVGILQHPDIKANKQGASFDVLIVDEASKVTFSDFIVPALHAKKWILVGDVKQLSPYVENDYVSENISTMIDKDTQQQLVQQFDLKTKLIDKRFDDCLKVYFTDRDPIVEQNSIDGNKCIEIIDVNWEATADNVMRLNAADIVIVKNDSVAKKKLTQNLQVKSIFINGEPNKLQYYVQDGFRISEKRKNSYLFESKGESWSHMVSGRLSQSFSFRTAEGFENIDRELEYLIPNGFKVSKQIRNSDGGRTEDVDLKTEINGIRRLIFPSILELLQNGIGKSDGQQKNRVLSDGFHSYYKTSRFTSLSFQHRMHPDIARTSQENFYNQNNLLPANTVLINREWNYQNDSPVVKWFHNNYNCANGEQNKKELERWFEQNNNTKNKKYQSEKTFFLKTAPHRIINPIEVDDMIRELKKFLEYAKQNPLEEGKKYEVAVLTFYLHQETELRKEIRKLTAQMNRFSKFDNNNTNIFLYTVDKFQGQEADLVLLGFTKYSRDAHFNSPNRLNVALTRARHKLILFGNKEWFKQRAKLKALRELATNFESVKRY